MRGVLRPHLLAGEEHVHRIAGLGVGPVEEHVDAGRLVHLLHSGHHGVAADHGVGVPAASRAAVDRSSL